MSYCSRFSVEDWGKQGRGSGLRYNESGSGPKPEENLNYDPTWIKFTHISFLPIFKDQNGLEKYTSWNIGQNGEKQNGKITKRRRLHNGKSETVNTTK